MPITAYEVILADTEAARRIHHQIRYQIYCLQAGYEDPAIFPDGQERDAWDPYAAHFLVRARETQEWVGTMRMILPGTPSLPIEEHTQLTSPHTISNLHRAEISRLCLVDASGSMAGGEAAPYRSAMRQRRRTGEILLALLHAAVALSRDQDMRYWYLLTTQCLSRIITRLIPMDMVQVGAPCWHRGERLPYLVDVQQVAAGLGHNGASALLDRWPPYRRASELAAGRRRPHLALPAECLG